MEDGGCGGGVSTIPCLALGGHPVARRDVASNLYQAEQQRADVADDFFFQVRVLNKHGNKASVERNIAKA